MTNKNSEHKNRVEAQTSREWIFEYIHSDKVWPSAWGIAPVGYISIPDDFEPELKEKVKPNKKARVRVRL